MTAIEILQTYCPGKTQEWYNQVADAASKIYLAGAGNPDELITGIAKLVQSFEKKPSHQEIEEIGKTPTENERYRSNLDNKALVEKVYQWVKKLCDTGGKAWSLRVPVDFNHDPDMVIIELGKRYEEALSLLDKAAGLVGNPGAGISASTDLAADKWQEEHTKFIRKYESPF